MSLPAIAVSTLAALGITGLVASIGGPPLALLYRSAKGATVRASLGIVFALGVTISLTARWIASEISADDLLVAALLLPSMALGLWLGRSWAGRGRRAPPEDRHPGRVGRLGHAGRD